MGRIAITIEGSFECEDSREFSAAQSGHTVALEDAIEWLKEKMSSVVAQDGTLRQNEHAPVDNWKELDNRKGVSPVKFKIGFERVRGEVVFDDRWMTVAEVCAFVNDECAQRRCLHIKEKTSPEESDDEERR